MFILIKTGYIYLTEEYLEYHDNFCTKIVKLESIYSINIIQNLTIIYYEHDNKICLRPVLFNKTEFNDALIKKLNVSEVKKTFFRKKIYIKK